MRAESTRVQARPRWNQSAAGERNRLGRAALHLLPQAQGAHVRPDLLDVREALGLRARLAGVAPAERVLAVGWPDGILLLVVDDHLVDGRVFSLVLTHAVFPPGGVGRRGHN